MTDYDALIVGAGHNGLSCAAYLARTGRRVLVLEANSSPGGCAATREFAPGFSVSACAQWLQHLSPLVARELALERHGLRYAARDLGSVSLLPNGEHLVLLEDKLAGTNVASQDQQALQDFHQRTDRYAKLLATAFNSRAPRLLQNSPGDRVLLIKWALGLKLLGRDELRECLRILPMNLFDLLRETFVDSRVQGLLSVDGVLGAHAGPRSANTVFSYLCHRVGKVHGFAGPAQVSGGMGALGAALAASAEASDAEIRLSTPVAGIDTVAGSAIGVTLRDGTQLRAPLVISNADPVTTFERLVGYRNLETGLVRRVSQFRCASGTAKLHLALDGMPAFTGLAAELSGHRLVIAPDMRYIERAFNAVKYHEYASAPVFDISIPSIHDPGLAPPGKHVLSAIVQYVPYALRGGWSQHREAFIQLLVAQLTRFAPGLAQQVLASELLTPADLEAEFGMRGGHWHHGELSLDQALMMRPFPGACQYGTAIEGLYLCGAGSHPGGGVMGLAGRNAAREIIRRGGGA